jgi:hypothetical protein
VVITTMMSCWRRPLAASRSASRAKNARLQAVLRARPAVMWNRVKSSLRVPAAILPVEHQLASLTLLEQLKTVAGRHLETFFQRLLQAERDGLQPGFRLAGSQCDTV